MFTLASRQIGPNLPDIHTLFAVRTAVIRYSILTIYAGRKACMNQFDPVGRLRGQRVRLLLIAAAVVVLAVMFSQMVVETGTAVAEAALTPTASATPTTTATTTATPSPTATATTTATEREGLMLPIILVPDASPTATPTATATATSTLPPSPTATATQPASPTPSPTPTLPPLPPPTAVAQTPPIDFPAVRATAQAQGLDIAFNKIGFHVGAGGNREGLDDYIAALDAAGVPAVIKSANNAEPLYQAQQLMAESGVPHILMYRDASQDLKENEYNLPPQEAARLLWDRNLAAFPPELDPTKIWIETVNEPDKNRADWLAEFSLESAKLAVDAGYKYAAFSWSAGEPEPYHWESPEMLEFLRYAGEHPDQVAVSLHEYSYVNTEIARIYPWLVGRFQKLFAVCDKYGIPRPTVLITEWGWEYNRIPQTPAGKVDVDAAMEDIEWAAWLYAAYPQVLGVGTWYLGPNFSNIDDQVQQLIAPVTDYSLGNYFVIDPGFGSIDEEIFAPNPPTYIGRERVRCLDCVEAYQIRLAPRNAPRP